MPDLPQSILKRIRITSKKRLTTDFSGQYRSAFKGIGLLFDGVREYQSGDDVRYIDWNVSARANHLFIKEYIEERELTIVLACDISASMDFGSSRAKRDTMLETAALIMQCASLNNDRLSVLLFSDQVEQYFVPRKGSRYILKVLNDITSWKPRNRKTNISCAAEFLQKILKKRSVIFLLSDYVDDGYLSRLKVLSRKHDVIPVRVCDPLEKKLSLFGLTAFSDLETEGVIYADAFPKPVDDMIEGFDPLVVSTDAPVINRLLEYFTRRNRRRARRW
jgi:uncharacterized protein (DUF58 family)